ncbi:MAG: EAL domain-containing protein [Lysobacter sp.]|nr:EAL domain-containing protein [Lysobacter sp.]
MSKRQDPALRLMLVDDSAEEAEGIVSGLRNAGIAVRPVRPLTAEELGAALMGQPIDLILAGHPCTSIALKTVEQQVTASGKDIPLVAVVEQVDTDAYSELLDGVVRALALRHKPPQILATVRREWADLEARRAQRRLETQVRETERRCDALIESSRDPIAYVHEGMHIRANGAYLEMFGYESFEDIEGMSLLDLVAPRHVDGFKQLLKSMSKGEAPPARYELEARDIEGNAFPAVMEFTLAQYEGEACQQVIFRRQETTVDPELARKVEELRQLDQATGLLNRPTFLHALEDVVADAAQNGTQHGLLMVEPDHYQRLINEIGLHSADTIMAAIAERLRMEIGDSAIAARFSEHTLAVLVRNSDHAATETLATRICNTFAAEVFAIGERSGVITASIGGVQISQKNASVSQILAKAASGVQSAAGVGGNRFELFDPNAMDRAEAERIQAWVQRLRDALDNGSFVLHFQPVINLQGDNHPVYDTFLRLDGGDGELVSPLAFIQIAEEHGMLEEIDRYVVARAIELIAQREHAGKPVTLLVKVSQASLQNDALTTLIGEQLAMRGASGEYLALQLQEAKVFTHLHAVQQFAATINGFGCRLGLEQFGAGLDSFQLLTHVQPQLVKIDRSFIEDIPKNNESQQRVREIAQKARDLDILTIAEFVQDAASMSILFSAGVDYVEGHFLAAAGPEMNYDFE